MIVSTDLQYEDDYRGAYYLLNPFGLPIGMVDILETEKLETVYGDSLDFCHRFDINTNRDNHDSVFRKIVE